MTDWDRDRDQDRLDLPLGGRGEEPAAGPAASGPAAGGPTGWEAEAGSAEQEDWFGEPPPAPEPEAGRRDTGSRSRLPAVLLGLLALVVLLGLAVVVGYLLPRPGPALLRISPPVVDFEAVRVGETAPARELALASAGERPVEIGEIALAGATAGEFEIAADGCGGASLAPGRTCAVAVRFSPRGTGVRRASLEVPSRDGGEPSVVALVGEGVAPEPVVDRRRLDFARTEAGERSGGELVTVGNRGSAPFTLERMALEGEAAAEFVLEEDRCTGEALGPREECTVRVAFAPAREGERRAVLRLRTERSGRDRAEAALPAVELRGLGVAPVPAAPWPVATAPAKPPSGPSPTSPPPPPPPPAPPELSVEPASIAFGEVALGAEEEPEPVVYRNSGGSPLRIEAVAVAGSDAGAFRLVEDRCRGAELAPGERCTVQVVFRPRQEGVQRARIELRSAALHAAPVVALDGAGAAPRLRAAPPELDFGELRLGASAERRLVLSNSGRAPAAIHGFAASGPAVRDFAVSADGCPETVPLGPGERCEVGVRFAPSEEGERPATLVIRHGGPGAAVEVSLLGSGLPAPAPRISVSPAALRFPDQPVGSRSAIVTITVANRGSARLGLGEPRLEGRQAADFQIVPGSCDGAGFLVPGSDCTVGVRFAPSGPGSREARLVLPHDAEGGRAAVEVSGAGRP